MIPKIIHKVWFNLSGNDPVPPKKRYGKMINSLHKFHKEWIIITWNEKMCNNLIYKHYAWFVPIWETYKTPIYKIDAIRYFILHRYGGVYVDQDIEFLSFYE